MLEYKVRLITDVDKLRVLIVADMEWVSGFDIGEHMLAALHPPYSLVIWDIRNKLKLWKKTYTETLVSFNFDPFAPSKLACKFVYNKRYCSLQPCMSN
jgi:hypothetical protein